MDFDPEEVGVEFSKELADFVRVFEQNPTLENNVMRALGIVFHKANTWGLWFAGRSRNQLIFLAMLSAIEMQEGDLFDPVASMKKLQDVINVNIEFLTFELGLRAGMIVHAIEVQRREEVMKIITQ